MPVQMGMGVAIHASGESFQEFLVGGESQQRPGVAIHVVFQIKDFGEPGAGGFVFGPGTILVLGAHQVIDAAQDTGAIGIVEGA